jgi:peptidyl-prolyl cis-trans isomerase SurA
MLNLMRKGIDMGNANRCFGALLKACLVMVPLLGVSLVAAGPATAQAIVASVNGDPITNIDIDQRMKLLRVLHKPATREAAIESLFTERLELREAAKYGVNPRETDIGQEIVSSAKELKMDPQALVAALRSAGVSQDHFTGYFRASFGFHLLVQALNKGVEASEAQVREELARQGGNAAGTAYTVQQIIFTLPATASPAEVTARSREIEQLRGRFADCATGIPIARAINDVTVRDPLTRTSLELNEALKQLLDKTQVGHLTPPSRSSSGLEMVALCSKGLAKDDTAARQAIAQKLLAAHIAEDSARRLKEMRDRAVIVNASP